MNKKIKYIGLFAVIAVALIFLSGCTKTSTNNTNSTPITVNEDDITPGKPYLKMTIKDYPSSVENVCQSVKFTIEVENLGDTTLKYEDFKDKYALMITSDDAVDSDGDTGIGLIETTDFEDEYGVYSLMDILGDFGEIKPGETATLTVNNLNYVTSGQSEYYWTNNFRIAGNGTANYYAVFEEKSDSGYNKEISRSSSVPITTSVWVDEYEQTACDSEIITDESIDFYAY